MCFQDLTEGTKLCGFGLRNRGKALHFWDLRTVSAAGFLASEVGTKSVGLGAKSRSQFGCLCRGWEGIGDCGGKQGMGRVRGPSLERGDVVLSDPAVWEAELNI